MFRSVVHSQAVRLRRIIIDYGMLTFRLGELAQFFIDSNYPHNMVNDVLNKVGNFDRKLEYNVKSVRTSDILCVPWVSTFGPGNGELRRFVKNANATLVTSPLFNDHVLNNKPILNVVSRRAPNFRDKLFNQKQIGLNITLGSPTIRCTNIGSRGRGRPCMSCELMSNKSELTINNKPLKCMGGNCKTNNLIYCAQCDICSLSYFGKSVQMFSTRISQHRNPIISKSFNPNEIDDENTLAAHAYLVHDARTKSDFNSLYKFSVVRILDPFNLTKGEQYFINLFKTRRPGGLNVDNPINLPATFDFNI